jgi:hypothetical protein
VTVSDFLTATSYALRGTDEDTPTFGTEESTYWLNTLNRKKNELFNNSKVLWDSTFLIESPNEVGTVATTGTTALTGTSTKFTDYAVGDTILVSGETVRTIDTITSDTALTVSVAFSNTASALTFTRNTIIDNGVSTYSLHRSFIAPANKAYITTTSGDDVYVDFISPREQIGTSRKVYVSGINPKILSFTDDIETDEDIVGGQLFVPGYYMPSDLSLETDELPIADPYWAVMAVAAEIAFSDITYEDKVDGLTTKANALYMQMVRNSRRGTYNNPRTTPVHVQRIRSTEVN